MSDKHVRIQTDTLPGISDADYELLKECRDDFLLLAKKWGSFYITVFRNVENRKIVFKFVFGKLIFAKIDKLDDEKE